jgi:tetratricopeptide (TPR) repeat protein
MTSPRIRQVLGAATLIATVLAAPLAAAQNGGRLHDVQRAYAEVDYEKTLSLARAAIEVGGNDRASTAELYLMWATAAAALDQSDEAREAFQYAVAANPELKLDRSLSPKIRAPYLEARGAAIGADGRNPLEVTHQKHGPELELLLRDTLHVAHTIELGARVAGQQSYSRRRLQAAPSSRVPVPRGSELQLFLRVLDRHDNVLLEQGSPEDPRRIALVTSRQNLGPAPARAAAAAAPDASPTPYYVTAGALAGLGLVAGGVATAMYLRREDAARDWNGPGCEQPGMTRRQQCGSIDDRREQAEYLSIGFAATGGALLLGSLVSLVLAPSASRTNVGVEAAPERVMVRLQGRL